MVLFDQATYDKLVTPSVLSDRLRVNLVLPFLSLLMD